MKRILLVLALLLTVNAFAQQDAWVYFNDKPDSDVYFSNPLLMLSQRALDRRTTQNIPLDMKDVPIYQTYIDQVDAVEDIAVKAKSKWLNAVHVRGSIEAIQSLTMFSFVTSVDFADDSLDEGSGGRMPHQAQNANKVLDTQTTFSYGTSLNQIHMLNGDLLHQQDYTGSGKIIAVLDAGFPGVNVIDPFQRLRDNNQILGGYNFVARNDDIYTSNPHGTLVLSTMGGYVENQLVGTAPDAAYYLFITEDNSDENPIEESLWVEAAETADSLGVDIITSSLGYFTYVNPNYSYTYEDMNGTTSFAARGADIAFSRGMVVVISAGNSGAGANPHIGTPADAIHALTVGAVAADESYGVFSSIGPSFDGRVKPDVMAQGVATIVSNSEGEITIANGTSFSGPIIAGMVASLWQALPNKTNAEIVELVKESADLYNNPDTMFGYGIPDFSAALAASLDVNNPGEDVFAVYPNPTESRIFVKSPSDLIASEIYIYNNLGQLLLHGNVGTGGLSLEQFQSGIYLYKIQSGNFSQSGKIIKK